VLKLQRNSRGRVSRSALPLFSLGASGRSGDSAARSAREGQRDFFIYYYLGSTLLAAKEITGRLSVPADRARKDTEHAGCISNWLRLLEGSVIGHGPARSNDGFSNCAPRADANSVPILEQAPGMPETWATSAAASAH